MVKSILDIATMNSVIDKLRLPNSAVKEELKKLTNKLSMIADADLALHDTTKVDAISDLLELLEELATRSMFTNKELRSRIQKIERDLDVAAKPSSSRSQIKRDLDVAAKPSSSRRNKQENSNGKVTGREKEKKKIDQLLSNTNITILPIVGIEGIGKTALAKLIYDDYRGSKGWVDSGELSNRESIDNLIVEVNKSEHRMHNRLPEAIGKRRYLAVLDDVKSANPEEWGKLTKVLPPDGTILITTRSVLVARITGTVPPVALQGLSEQDSWSLFKEIASSKDQSDSISKDIGRKMVEKCQGVPLAIITMGSLWRESPDSKKNIELMEKKFLRELELIYFEELPFPLKFCFAFCSLFPNSDDGIDVSRLINLWMGERFILPRFTEHGRPEYEAVGEEYFQDLYGRSIFQDVREDELGNPTSCRMHPLMHYLALSVAREKSIAVDPDGKVRHASFDFSWAVPSEILEPSWKEADSLQTILLPAAKQSLLPKEMKMSTSTCEKIFTNFQKLRVLDLHDLGIKTVPSSIGDLRLLRYLDLSKNSMKKLPSSITKLKYLQTLRLSQCRELKELPEDLDNLTKLRHLEIDGCLDLTHMPERIKNMTSLRTLSLFVGSPGRSSSIPILRGPASLTRGRSRDDTGGIRELAGLNCLRGVLEIAHLECCVAEDAAKANLQEKHDLQRLILKWDHKDEGNVKTPQEEEVLKELEPPEKLKALFLMGYGGTTLSRELKMSSLKLLVKFSLYNCSNCESLPLLHVIAQSSIKILELQRLNSLKFVVDRSGRDASSENTIFPSLKKLKISDCRVFSSWWENVIPLDSRPSFPRISTLDIQYCPELTCMPLFADLDEKLELVSSSVSPVMDTMKKSSSPPPFSKLKSMLIANINQDAPALQNSTSLQYLHIRECHHLKSLPEGFQNLTSLENLIIEDCKELDLIKDFKNLKNLRTLTIRGIPKLKSLPMGLESVTSLQELRLHGCSELTSLSDNIGELNSLKTLVITECCQLASLPKALGNLKSLHTFTIKNCPKLVLRCQPETGDDWPQIARIKNLSVWQTSNV